MADYVTIRDWSKYGLPLAAAAGRGRTEVRLDLLAQGRDLVLLVGGGDVHVGAGAVAGGGAEGLAVLPPHKEGPLAAECAALLAEAGGCSCAVVAGIHQDDVTRDEIAAILGNVRTAARELAEAVTRIRKGNAP